MFLQERMCSSNRRKLVRGLKGFYIANKSINRDVRNFRERNFLILVFAFPANL